jgi:hypothetical protein
MKKTRREEFFSDSQSFGLMGKASDELKASLMQLRSTKLFRVVASRRKALTAKSVASIWID